jgi:dipeptide/tripeptide permease
MLKLVVVIAVIVILAMTAGEVVVDAVGVGYVMKENDAKLEAARSAGW